MEKDYIGGILSLAVAAINLTFGAIETQKALESMRWPSTTAKVVRSVPGRGNNCIAYTYNVSGKEYTSSRVQMGQETSRADVGPGCTAAALALYPQDKVVEAHYNRNNPGESVLETGINGVSYILLGVGTLFAFIGLHFLWRQLSLSIYRGKPVPIPGLPGPVLPASASIPPPSWDLITPSEVVAMYADRFAAPALSGNVQHMEAIGEVCARDLVQAALKAAFFAHEQAGTIRFSISGDKSPVLWIEPTGLTHNWPNPSTESRLEFLGKEKVETVVRRWLGELSFVPVFIWPRAAEKTVIPIVLRGAAKVHQQGRTRNYSISDENTKAAAADRLPFVASLLAHEQTSRAQEWKLLSDGINNAKEADGPPITNVQLSDAWSDEAQVDIERTPGLKTLDPPGLTWAGAIVWALIAAGLSWLVVDSLGPNAPLIVALCTLGGAGIFLTARRNSAFILPLMEKRSPYLRTLANDLIQGNWIIAATIALPWLTFAFLLVYTNLGNPVNLVGLVTAGIAVGMWFLRRKAGESITSFVVGKPSVPQPPPAAITTSTAVPLELPFQLEIITPSSLPEPSIEAQAQLTAIRERGPAIKKLYNTSTYCIMGASLLLALLSWYLQGKLELETFPYFSLFSAFVTLIAMGVLKSDKPVIMPLLALAGYAFRLMRGGAAQDRSHWEQEIQPIRPLVAPIAAWYWILFTLTRSYSSSDNVSLFLALAITVSYILYLRRARKQLEAKYPVYPGLNLLSLRVFGSSNSDFFRNLIDRWHWFGPLFRLNGPDTAGGNQGDLNAWITGRLDKAVIENQAELDQAVHAFKEARDSQLRFSWNSMQCNDLIWKQALQTMFDRADVVAMDLSSLTESNRGCAYEIGKLLHEVPLDRFFLFINDETDLVFLRQLLAELTANSKWPSTVEHSKLRLFQLGTPPIRNKDETIQDWQRRFCSPIESERLIALLFDAARRKTGTPSPVTLHWARPGYRR